MDLKDIFESMPSNFIPSFIRNQNSKGDNLPALYFKPKYDAEMKMFKDLQYIESGKILNDFTVLNRKNYNFNLMIEIKFDSALGVPIPDKQEIPRESLIHRKVYMCLYNGHHKKYIGNTCRVAGIWDET